MERACTPEGKCDGVLCVCMLPPSPKSVVVTSSIFGVRPFVVHPRCLRSSRDESFVGRTLSWSTDFRRLFSPSFCHNIPPFLFFFFLPFGLQRNGATAANPGISDARTPRKFFPSNKRYTCPISIFQTYSRRIYIYIYVSS